MVTAMGEGLTAARLYNSVLEVKHAAEKCDARYTILGGEQKRSLIPGFNRDNSPMSYMKGVEGKMALMLTTNGTRALPWIRKAKILVMGSFLNVSGVIRTIMHHAESVDSVILVCAGTDRGTVRAEDDELCAAYILKTLIMQATDPSKLVLDSSSTQVLQRIQNKNWCAIEKLFHTYPAADELRALGMEGDLDFCLMRDKYADILPVYHANSGTFLVHRVPYEIPLRPMKDPTPDTDDLSNIISPSSSKYLNIYLVCSVNPEHRLTGHIDPVLGKEEKRRALDVTALLSEKTSKLQAVMCSPLRRARATAELIASRHNLAPVIFNGLTAVDYGDWTGLRVSEVKEHFPGEWEKWNSLPTWDEHGGESYSALMARSEETFIALCKTREKGSVCVVTHQSSVRSIIGFVNKLSQVEWCALEIPQASLSLIRYYPLLDEYELVYRGLVGRHGPIGQVSER